MIRQLLLLFALPIIIFNCDQKSAEQINSNEIVLIIHKCPNYSRIVYENGSSAAKEGDVEIFYRDEQLIQHKYITSKPPKIDTLIIPIFSDPLEIEHIYKVDENVSFLFYKGDTVHMTYDKDFPYATVINRLEDSISTNYVYYRRKALKPSDQEYEGYAAYRRANLNSLFKSIKSHLKGPEFKIFRWEENEKSLAEFERYMQAERIFLDSLKSSDLIPDAVYRFFKQKTQVQYDFEMTKHIHQTPEDLMAEKGMEKPLAWQAEDSIRDELLRYGYYYTILNDLEYSRYHLQAPIIKLTARRLRNHKVIYDSIRSSHLFTLDEKKILLTDNMKSIIEYFTPEDVSEYFRKYIKDIHNDALVYHVVDEYMDYLPTDIYELLGINNSENFRAKLELSLINQLGEEKTFTDVLDENRWKMVYVDFWSTTCLPCLIALPKALNLDADYDDDKVQFVYISMDKDAAKWAKTNEKLGLLSNPDSFIINFEKNKGMLDSLKILEIPRYLLFDQSGTMIQYKAFGPESDEIRETLDNYILSD